MEREERQVKMCGAITASNYTTSRVSSNTLSVLTDPVADLRTQREIAKPNLGGSNCVTADRGLK